MNKLKRGVWFLCFFSYGVYGQDLLPYQNPCERFKAIDEQHYKAYREILTIYKEDTLFIQKFIEAEQVWVHFRESYVESIFPDPDRSQYGPSYAMCHCEQLAQVTQQRLVQLKLWLEALEDVADCLGSRKPNYERRGNE